MCSITGGVPVYEQRVVQTRFAPLKMLER